MPLLRIRRIRRRAIAEAMPHRLLRHVTIRRYGKEASWPPGHILVRSGPGPADARSSPLGGAPPVEHSTVSFGRPPGTAIPGRHRNGGSRRPRRCSVQVAGHGVGCANPLLDHPDHLDDPRRLTDQGAHLVAGRQRRRRLSRPIVDPHVAASACGGGVGPGLRQPHRPQPPIHAGRLHDIHHVPPGAGSGS